MKNRNLAFIDLETTGLDPIRNEIIEIGGIVAKQIPIAGRGSAIETIAEFEYKIKPKNLASADPEALRINGYNDADWLFAADLKQVLPTVADKTEGAIMVAHNVIFDLGFLNQAFLKTGIKNKMHYHKIDLLAMAFAKLYHNEEVQYFNLASLAKYFGISNPKAHTALADTQTAFAIYCKLLEI
jgi:DNA polymerase III epsilon subunit family exonuclease